MATNSFPIVEACDLKIQYGGKSEPVIMSFEPFELDSGDFMIIEGKNGIGKSTFLKVFTGESTEGAGRYAFIKEGKLIVCSLSKDTSINLLPNTNLLRNGVAYVGQEETAGWADSVYAVLKGSASRAIENANKNRNEKKLLRKEMNRYLEKTMQDLLERKVFPSNFHFHLTSFYSCSGGQRKIVQILASFIKAKIMKSELVLMDEPLNNLDRDNKVFLNALVDELRSSQPRLAVVVITHCRVFKGINKRMVMEEDQTNEENCPREVRVSVRPIKSAECYFHCLESGAYSDSAEKGDGK